MTSPAAPLSGLAGRLLSPAPLLALQYLPDQPHVQSQCALLCCVLSCQPRTSRGQSTACPGIAPLRPPQTPGRWRCPPRVARRGSPAHSRAQEGPRLHRHPPYLKGFSSPDQTGAFMQRHEMCFPHIPSSGPASTFHSWTYSSTSRKPCTCTWAVCCLPSADPARRCAAAAAACAGVRASLKAQISPAAKGRNGLICSSSRSAGSSGLPSSPALSRSVRSIPSARQWPA